MAKKDVSQQNHRAFLNETAIMLNEWTQRGYTYLIRIEKETAHMKHLPQRAGSSTHSTMKDFVNETGLAGR